MREDLAISITGLKKKYKLGAIGGGTLKGDVQSWWARKRGKEDPNSIIGTEDVKIGEEFYALNGIEKKKKKGEALGIIGMNGAGKSTLLKILSRVTAPSEGEVRIKGRITSMLEVGTGFHGELTGRENIYMNGAILGMTRKEVDEKIEEIIDFSECRQFIDTPVKRYSSGMYVKLGFSVAAHLDSEIMIMDEVLAVGDMRFQQKCLNAMGIEAGKNNKTILYVSHNMNTIRQLCTRCIVLNKGRIIYDGDVEKAIELYAANAESNKTHVELDSIERKLDRYGEFFRYEDVEFLDKDSMVMDFNESLKVRLKWKANKDISNVRHRIDLWSDDNVRVGCFFSDVFECKSGEEYKKDYTLDLRGITPGLYKISLFASEFNEYGGSIEIDHLEAITGFELTDDASDGIAWKKQWGHIKLSNLISCE